MHWRYRKVSKKLWIRLVGVLALFAWGSTAIVWASMIGLDVATKVNLSILMFVSLVGAGLMTFMWTLLSLVDRLDHPVRGQGASR
jgi:hypothetical protein